MSEVKWIKITTDMFDNRKIKHLRKMPEGNNIVLIWVMLLTMAGRCNSGGMIFLTENIPYTTKMLADELDFDESTIILALRVLSEFGMIVFDENKFAIQNWEEHQNIDGMERIREQNRLRKQKQREREKQLIEDKCHVTSHATVTTSHATDIDKDKEIDIYNNNIFITEKSETKKTNYQQIVDKYNSICKSLPKVKKLSDARKKSIKARLNKYSFDEIITVFEKAEASRHLTGDNNYNWRADFDWLMSDKNMAKVFDGKYDNEKMFKNNNPKNATVTSSNTVTDRNTNTYTPKTTNRFNNFEQRQYSDDELDALERKLLSR